MTLPRFVTPRRVLATNIALYCILFFTLTLWKYGHFFYDNLDLAIINQVVFTTAFGNPFAATIHPPSYLIDHFSPFLLLIAPFYRLIPRPETLLVLQTITIAITALPIYAIGKKLLQGSWLPVLPAVIWLWNPLTHNMNFFEFHTVSFAALFLLSALYGYIANKKILFFIFLLLAISTREDIALIVLCMSLLALFERKKLFWLLTPAILGVCSLALSFSIIGAASGDAYKFSNYYGWLGGTSALSIAWSFITHPIDVILHLANFGNFEFFAELLFPFFFGAVVIHPYFFLGLAPLSQILLSAQGGSALIVSTHYAGLFLPALILLLIVRLSLLQRGIFPRIIPKALRFRIGAYFIFLAAAVYSAAVYGSVIPTIFAWTTDNHESAKNAILSRIPTEASVATTFETLPQLSSRDRIYLFPYAYLGSNQYGLSTYALPEDTDYLVIDWDDMLTAHIHYTQSGVYGSKAQSAHENMTAMLSSFNVEKVELPVMLFSQSAPRSALSELRNDENLDRPDDHPVLHSAVSGETAVHLTIALPKQPQSDFSYAILVETDATAYKIPLGYLMFPPKTWGDNEAMIMEVPGLTENARLTVIGWNEQQTSLSNLKSISVETNETAFGPTLTAKP